MKKTFLTMGFVKNEILREKSSLIKSRKKWSKADFTVNIEKANGSPNYCCILQLSNFI